MSGGPAGVYEFGPFRLDPAECRLWRGGEPVPLSPRVFDLTVVLVAHAGRLLLKGELIEMVWGTTHVEEANLNVAMSALRKALGDSAETPMYVETVPRRGYRFVAPVRILAGDPAAAADGTAPPVRPLRVLLVDDHPIVRAGARAVLERTVGYEVVAEAGDLATARERLALLQPDLVILDMMIGTEESLGHLRDWLAAAPRTQFVVLSIHDDVVHARRALAAGARAYVMKGELIEELVAALATVTAGGMWVSRRAGAAILSGEFGCRLPGGSEPFPE